MSEETIDQTQDSMEAPPAPQEDLELLSEGELKYINQLESKNTLLTIALGNKTMELEEAKKTLAGHRQEFIDYYISTLKAHGVKEGNISLQKGAIIVRERIED